MGNQVLLTWKSSNGFNEALFNGIDDAIAYVNLLTEAKNYAMKWTDGKETRMFGATPNAHVKLNTELYNKRKEYERMCINGC